MSGSQQGPGPEPEPEPGREFRQEPQQGPGPEPEPEPGREFRQGPQQGPARIPPPPPPGPGYPFPTPPPPRPVAKHLVVGALLGIVASVVLPFALMQVDSTLGGTGIFLGAGLLLTFVLAIVLTVLPRTRLLGAGMFIGFGVVLIGGAGLCVALLATMG